MAIIDDQIKKPEATTPPATEYKAPTVEPVTSEVDADTETVENRLTNLTAGGSRYVEQARSDAIREANSRGLINSTMAGASGVDAAIRNALPIAQQDASTYTDTRFQNTDAQNQFQENRQNANLNMEAAAHQSQLILGEMATQSGLTKDEMATQSALTNEENTLLNDLTMKRDQSLSGLTIQEQNNLAALEAKRDEALHVLDIQRDNNSSQLNESLATLESSLRENEMALDSELKTAMEITLNDVRFSDEMKLQMVTTMNNIIRDAQSQIVDIGLSDRSAAAQAEAIKLVQDNRDAELAVYQDLLQTFPDWDWGTNFTPSGGETAAATPTATPTATPAPVATTTSNQQSIINDVGVNWGGGGGGGFQ